MVMLPEDIQAFIANALPCDYVRVEGDGTHFEAVIVSAEFRGKTMVQQHQLVYRALGDRMQQQIHALSMKTFTPEQWAELAGR
ncbi:MAG: BolA family transcriptional regulator [Betaproteobacteria bacterium]|nr:BolA family transcriptional regulator [Betaproteobacteria bacterium]